MMMGLEQVTDRLSAELLEELAKCPVTVKIETEREVEIDSIRVVTEVQHKSVHKKVCPGALMTKDNHFTVLHGITPR